MEREQAELEEAAANAQNDDDEDDDEEDGEEEDGADSDKENEDEEQQENDVEEFKSSMRKLEKNRPQTSQQLNIDESLFKLEDLPDLDDELEKLEI